MHLEAHAGLGWLLAQVGNGGRRFRGAVLLAAVLPDLDAASYLFGPEVYIRYHHVLGHNLVFSLAVSAAAAGLCRGGRLKAFLFTQLAFYTHFFGDYFFTVYTLKYFYPFSQAEFLSEHALWLGHPLNTAFVCVGIALVFVLALWCKRTPIELLSPELDERLVNMFFRRRTLACSACGRKCNERCAPCGEPVCGRHGLLGRGFRVTCGRCREKDAPSP